LYLGIPVLLQKKVFAERLKVMGFAGTQFDYKCDRASYI